MVLPESGGDTGLSSRTHVPRSAVVTVGDELLNGETVDTNAAWLGRELAAVGAPVWYHHTVGDDAADIRNAVEAAAHGAELVVVSGGLGPTRDDRTRAAVAELFGRPLVEDAELLEALRRRFRELGYDRMPEPNRSQALVPHGARVLPNPRGTAPGLALDEGDALVVLLPGVPQELRGIFDDELRAIIGERLEDRLAPVVHRLLHTTGIAESRLSELVDDALPDDTGGVSVAFLPDALGVDLRLTVRGVLEPEAGARLDRIEGLLTPVIEPWRFESESGDLAEAVVDELRARGATLALAESCTGGLVAQRVTRIAGVSDVFLGGIVAYANEVKRDLLGISQGILERHGAVSEEVARAMAVGVARACGSSVGLGVTGVAGPTGGSEEKPVGTVWTAVSYSGEVTARLRRFPGDRERIQARAAQDALRTLRATLRDGASTSEP